ncbi:endonuclease/exonuclease/phosphatase family protein [Vibrio harveyi]|uniref:endonuclease/exonuclease/phosphatase family protein n=1 Tax=Vibrio harveyi TaxID=669 RepID=UPI000680D0AD|nr:endonuclease/exonuclease/phosphatase family protein [Vibrio harveyi]
MLNTIKSTKTMLLLSSAVLASYHANANEEMKVLTPMKDGVPDKVYTQNHPQITISTYNIAAARVGTLDGIAEGIKTLNSDITAIIEIDKKTKRSGNIDQLALLKEKTNLHGEFAKTINFDGGEYGVAVMSKYPILKTESIQIPSGDEQLVLYAAEIKIPSFDSPILFLVAHYDWYADPKIRVEESYAINNYILGNSDSLFKNISSRIVILAGDFNAVPSDESMFELSKYWNLVEKDTLDIRTWPTDNPIIGIDHILTSNAQKWQVMDLAIPQQDKASWAIRSDHLPVTAKLKLLEQ